MTIKASVGDWAKGAKNNPQDVEIVQKLLQKLAKKKNDKRFYPGIADSKISRNAQNSATVKAILAYQAGFMSNPDGVVSPPKPGTKRTIDRLIADSGASNELPTLVTISDAVGKGCKNNPQDVKTIQILLNKSPITSPKLVEDGKYGKNTFRAILKFQMSIYHKTVSADGVINPKRNTFKALINPATKAIKSITDKQVETRALALGGYAAPSGNKASSFGKLKEADFEAAAKRLGSGVEVAVIKAIAAVESGGRSGFSKTGFPKIAFEGHVFRRYTKKKYDKSHPLLSYAYVEKAGPEWKKNNKDDATAEATLKSAVALDKESAYKSCSWGMFQIMGFNYKKCGYGSVDAFVTAMKAGESGQLKAFVGFCKNTKGMVTAMEKKNFVQCATLYNGEDYGDYDKRMLRAYKKYSKT